MNLFKISRELEFLEKIPKDPGVYCFWGPKNEPIYIGKAKNLRRRLLQYWHNQSTKKRKKTQRIIKKATHLSFQTTDSELTALLLETQLIQAHLPEINISGKYFKQYPFIGFRNFAGKLDMLLTTDTNIPGFEFFGVFRSRLITSEAFYSLVKILCLISYREKFPIKERLSLPKRTRIFRFRRVYSGFCESMRLFFWGDSQALVSELFQKLLDSSRARAQSESVEEYLKAIQYFYREEVLPLQAARVTTNHSQYPVKQNDRDPLFIQYRGKIASSSGR